jgi:hypothetical protein
MIGSGFIGWAFVLGWLVAIVVVWWTRPLGGADRTTRLSAGVLAIGCLAFLSTLGGFYLIPSVVVWIALVATSPPPDLGTRSSPEHSSPPPDLGTRSSPEHSSPRY